MDDLCTLDPRMFGLDHGFRVERLVATSRRLVDESQSKGRLSLSTRLIARVDRVDRLVKVSRSF